MKHKITQSLDLALLLSREPDQGENQNNTEAKQVVKLLGTKSDFRNSYLPFLNIVNLLALQKSADVLITYGRKLSQQGHLAANLISYIYNGACGLVLLRAGTGSKFSSSSLVRVLTFELG